MKERDWKRLAILSKADLDAIYHQIPMADAEKQELNTLLDKTKEVDEHPAYWDWGCLCQLCCSYGD